MGRNAPKALCTIEWEIQLERDGQSVRRQCVGDEKAVLEIEK